MAAPGLIVVTNLGCGNAKIEIRNNRDLIDQYLVNKFFFGNNIAKDTNKSYIYITLALATNKILSENVYLSFADDEERVSSCTLSDDVVTVLVMSLF